MGCDTESLPPGQSDKVKQVILMRDDLQMRKGKMIAQGAHASMKVLLDAGFYSHLSHGEFEGDALFVPLRTSELEEWLQGQFTKICVRVSGETALLSLIEDAKNRGVPCSLIEDSGLTEFNGVPTITCGAIGPAKSSVIDPLTRHLKLF
jgi:PTH2 family peptidyl-tRNA hydrolase